jgi:hypothetical protein
VNFRFLEKVTSFRKNQFRFLFGEKVGLLLKKSKNSEPFDVTFEKASFSKKRKDQNKFK